MAASSSKERAGLVLCLVCASEGPAHLTGLRLQSMAPGPTCRIRWRSGRRSGGRWSAGDRARSRPLDGTSCDTGRGG
eukprot:scaffold8911_cov76-Isochrysis_galbana.AAC.2